jgi:hypothetical protein
MATVAESLFGVTPESLQRQRQQQLRQEAMDFASISDPFQQANFAIYQGAGNLARGVGGMLGAQDPELMRVRQRQELLQGVNPADPASLRQAAQRAMEANDFQAAQLFSDRALSAETAQAKLESERALTTQRNRERAAAGLDEKVFAALAAKATPASVKAAQDAGNDISLLVVPENVKVSTYGQVLKDAGLKEGTPEFQKQMQAFANAELESTRKGKGTNVNVAVSGQKAFSEKMGELDAKRVSDALSARDNAFSTIRSLNQLANLDDQGLISGSFATGRVGVTNLLNTLGLASPADQARLASSQNYQKVAGDVILGVLGGKLGAGFSNEDRKFIEGLVPQLETSPMARRQLINFMTRKNMDIAEEATRLETYARDKDGLKGFQPKIPLGANIPATSMSADDLAKAAGGKIVNGKFVPNK